jgi:hypothetical protein
MKTGLYHPPHKACGGAKIVLPTDRRWSLCLLFRNKTSTKPSCTILLILSNPLSDRIYRMNRMFTTKLDFLAGRLGDGVFPLSSGERERTILQNPVNPV